MSLRANIAAPITVQTLPKLGVTILTVLAGTEKVLFRGSTMRFPVLEYTRLSLLFN
jgi:hypothetical protein